MSPQDEREAIARVIFDATSDRFMRLEQCYPAADAILALRQPGAEYRRGVEAEGVTSDSDVYKHTFYGILNAQGEFWTPLAYPSKHEADNALDRFIGADEKRFGNMRSTHRIVPVRIQLTALLPESTKGEGR